MRYELTLKKNSDNFVLNKADATNNGETKIIGIEWYVPDYPPSMEQQEIISK